MECRHSIISLDHDVEGEFKINGQVVNLTGGKGYAEGDRGHSFPENYTWIQCNSFKHDDDPCSVMLAIAKVPFMRRHFTGCICIVYWQGKEYRLATYKGVRILKNSLECIEIEQGRFRLQITVSPEAGHELFAPDKGNMNRFIHESPNCKARFRFFIDDRESFDKSIDYVSVEHVQ